MIYRQKGKNSVTCCKKNIKPVGRAMLNLLGNIKSHLQEEAEQLLNSYTCTNTIKSAARLRISK